MAQRERNNPGSSLGRYDTALHEDAAAEQVYERSGLQRELIEALNDTGGLYELLGDGAAADMRFQGALRLAQKISNAAGASTSLLALGELERRRKQNDAADTYFGRPYTVLESWEMRSSVVLCSACQQ